MTYGFNIFDNSKTYYVFCTEVYSQKIRNFEEGMEIVLVYKVSDMQGNNIPWRDIKGTSLEQKIRTYSRNTINGQRSLVWGKDKPNENGSVIGKYFKKEKKEVRKNND